MLDASPWCPPPYSVGWSLEASEIQPVLDPIAPRQRYEKLWTWTWKHPEMQAPAALRELLPWIRTLVIATPGHVIVSLPTARPVDIQLEVPLVRVTSATEQALETMRLWRDANSNTLKVSSTSYLLGEFVLVEVFLPRRRVLQTIECEARTSVVVEDQVLLSDAPEQNIRLKLTSSGVLHVVSRTELHAAALDAIVVGSGTIQILAPSMVFHDKIEANVTSSGAVRLCVNNLYAENLKLVSTGMGDVQLAVSNIQGVENMEATMLGAGSIRVMGEALQAARCTITETGSASMLVATQDELELGTLKCSVTGNGRVRFGCYQSICQTEEVSVCGAGMVDLQDVMAAQAYVNTLGASHVKFQAYHQVKAKTIGNGEVLLVGNPPQWMEGNVKLVLRSAPPLVNELLASRKPPIPIPTRANAFEHAIEADIFTTFFVYLFRFLYSIWMTFADGIRTCVNEPESEPMLPVHHQRHQQQTTK